MKIGIVGLGLIGGSIGLRLQALNHTVFGVVNNTFNEKKAIERKLATYVTTDLNVLKECSIIFLALPIRNLINPKKELIETIPQDAIITDVGSIKEPIINTWESVHRLFVGSHPMAGNEFKGVNAGNVNLFDNSKWIITKTTRTDEEAVKKLSKLIISMHCEIIYTTPKDHDKATSLISHLPIFLGSSLIQTAYEDNDKDVKILSQKIASSGFADSSRVGGGNAELGRDLAEFNNENILNSIQRLKANLDDLEKIIIEKNWVKLYDKLEKSKDMRKKFLN